MPLCGNQAKSVMNFSAGTIASRHGYSKTIPKGCFRRGVGVLLAPYTSRSSGKTHPNARVGAARGLQRILRWIVRTGSCVEIPAPRPAYTRETIYQQTQRWIKAGVFRGWSTISCACFCDLRKAGRRTPHGGQTRLLAHSEIHPGERAWGRLRYGHKGKKGSKLHAAVDTLGHLLALRGSPASEEERQEVRKLCEEIERASGENVELAYVDQGYTGERASGFAAEHGIRLEVVKHEEAKRGLRTTIAEALGGGTRFRVGIALPRRLVKDYERLPETVAGLHFVAFACLFLQQAAGILSPGS